MADYQKESSRTSENHGSPTNVSKDKKNIVQDEKLDQYMRQLLSEKSLIDEAKCPFAYKFIDEEISRVQQKLVKGPPRDTKFLDIYHERPVKITAKVLLPVKEHPRFNFVGKLLGPKGNTLKQLQEDTMCYMNICGRGSMRDRDKEEELRRSLEPKYAHLTDDLHVEISTIAAPADAHNRISSALTHLRKFFIPEYNTPDMIDEDLIPNKTILGKVRFEGEEWHSNHKRSSVSDEVDHNMLRKASRPPSRSLITSKSSVMSILNKARIAMQESHGYEDRRNTRMLGYEEYTDDDYYPKPKRYIEGSPSYGKNISDVSFKKRKY